MQHLHLSFVYLTDIIEIGRGDSSIFDPLVLATIGSASVTQVMQDPDLDRAYSALDAPPPDEVRRPTTINALANSLGLPFESVRRAVHRLAEQGLVELTRRGVLQSAAGAHTPSMVQVQLAQYARTRRLYEDLQATDFPPLREPAQPGLLTEPPVRLVNRLLGVYVLRMATRVIGWVGGATRALVYLEAARLSYEGLPVQATLPGHPVRPIDLARRAKLPDETARRHMVALAKAGFLVREGPAFVMGPDAAGAEAARADLRRLVERLDRMGVRAWWDAERAAIAPSAERSGTSRR